MTGMTLTVARKPKPPPPPPRPTVADVDSWLAQIDQVLADAPPRKPR